MKPSRGIEPRSAAYEAAALATELAGRNGEGSGGPVGSRTPCERVKRPLQPRAMLYTPGPKLVPQVGIEPTAARLEVQPPHPAAGALSA